MSSMIMTQSATAVARYPTAAAWKQLTNLEFSELMEFLEILLNGKCGKIETGISNFPLDCMSKLLP